MLASSSELGAAGLWSPKVAFLSHVVRDSRVSYDALPMAEWPCCGCLGPYQTRKSHCFSKRQDVAWGGCTTRASTYARAASFARDLCAKCCRNQRASKSVTSRHSAKCSSANPKQTCGSGRRGTSAVFRGTAPRLLRRAFTPAPRSKLCSMALYAGAGAPGEHGPTIIDASGSRSTARDPIQHGHGVTRQFQVGGRKIFTQMRHRRGARNQQDVGRALEQPGERNLHRRRA